MKIKYVTATSLLIIGMLSTANAEEVPTGSPAMSKDTMQAAFIAQQAAFEKRMQEQNAWSEQYRKNLEMALEAQKKSAEAHQKAMIKHMAAVRAQVEAMAAQTQQALETHTEAQQRRIYGYMLGMMPEGKIKESFKQSEAKRLKIVEEMKVKREKLRAKFQKDLQAI